MKRIILSALVCLLLPFASCDKLKKDFNVNGVKFDFTAESKAGTATLSPGTIGLRAAATQTFTVTRTVDISEMGSADVIEYANKINSVTVNNSLINVTTTPAGNYIVENLTVTAVGVPGSLVVPSYTLGGAFTLPSDANAFTSAFIMKLVTAKTVSATVTGKTDAPAGTVINVRYESDLLIKASVL